jgi:hypothetical protein
VQALGQLLAAYFHQDWCLESPSWEAVVGAYVEGEPKELREQALEQLDTLIALPLSEAELARRCLDLGCYFEPSAVDMSYRSWLGEVRSHLAAART